MPGWAGRTGPTSAWVEPPGKKKPAPDAWLLQLTCKVGPPKVGILGLITKFAPSMLAFEVNFGFWPGPSARGYQKYSTERLAGRS